MAQADLILVNAHIVTMVPLMPRAQALAVRNGRILALGSDSDMRALAGPKCRVIDAGGRMVLPGFQDTHIHLQDSGQNYAQNADLSDARTIAALIAQLAAFAKANKQPWVKGSGWDSGTFGAANLTRHVLDQAVPDRPCLIVASDGHNACLNTRGLAAVGIGRDTPDPHNGHIVRDDKGDATGLLYEDAISWAETGIPNPSDADFAAGVGWASSLANRHGITGVIDARVEERHVRVYQGLAAADALTVRVAATALVKPTDSTGDALARISAFRADSQQGLFRVHSAKFFLDGVIENRTAAMIAPYSDAMGGNAPLMFEPTQIAEMFTAFDAARFQIHVHAIGDMATRAALDGMAVARHANGAWPSLHQIAHIQYIDPADIARFQPLGVMANMQPLWAAHGPALDQLSTPLVGPDRARLTYALRSLLDAGAEMALSSDWGVSTLNPFEIIETAVTRQPTRREGSAPAFFPAERITRAEAVAGYTTHAAAAAWRSADTGSLSPGKYADLIVLDRDIFTCDAADIGETEVLLTLLAGCAVHRSADFQGADS
jgi:predicted amidohydrolase YtcJ